MADNSDRPATRIPVHPIGAETNRPVPGIRSPLENVRSALKTPVLFFFVGNSTAVNYSYGRRTEIFSSERDSRNTEKTRPSKSIPFVRITVVFATFRF